MHEQNLIVSLMNNGSPMQKYQIFAFAKENFGGKFLKWKRFFLLRRRCQPTRTQRHQAPDKRLPYFTSEPPFKVLSRAILPTLSLQVLDKICNHFLANHTAIVLYMTDSLNYGRHTMASQGGREGGRGKVGGET